MEVEGKYVKKEKEEHKDMMEKEEEGENKERRKKKQDKKKEKKEMEGKVEEEEKKEEQEEKKKVTQNERFFKVFSIQVLSLNGQNQISANINLSKDTKIIQYNTAVVTELSPALCSDNGQTNAHTFRQQLCPSFHSETVKPTSISCCRRDRRTLRIQIRVYKACHLIVQVTLQIRLSIRGPFADFYGRRSWFPRI